MDPEGGKSSEHKCSAKKCPSSWAAPGCDQRRCTQQEQGLERSRQQNSHHPSQNMLLSFLL
jgi:hypothetical protein